MMLPLKPAVPLALVLAGCATAAPEPAPSAGAAFSATSTKDYEQLARCAARRIDGASVGIGNDLRIYKGVQYAEIIGGTVVPAYIVGFRRDGRETTVRIFVGDADFPRDKVVPRLVASVRACL